jgi:hypothetical protein
MFEGRRSAKLSVPMAEPGSVEPPAVPRLARAPKKLSSVGFGVVPSFRKTARTVSPPA